jgi:hypothetical protein
MGRDTDARIRLVLRYGGTAVLVVSLLHVASLVIRWFGLG